MRKEIFIIMLMLIVMLVSACSAQQTTTNTDSMVGGGSDVAVQENNVNPDSGTEDAVEPTGEVKEFTVEAYQFGFEPSVIEVNQGDTVKLSAYTRDVPHGLAIPEYGVDLYLDSSEPVTTEFVADTKGEFTFFCNVPCGRGHSSMRGTLIVN